MRCKIGDLCVIVRSWPENLGRLVTITGPARRSDADWSISPVGAPFLCKDSSTGKPRRARDAAAWDHQLRPIRPSEGDDETLQWAGKPETVSA